MNTGNSQSKSSTKTINKLDAYVQEVAKTLDERYRKLFDARKASDSISDRYELTIAMEEVKNIYNLLFKKGE